MFSRGPGGFCVSLGVGLPGGRQLSKRIFYYLRSSSYRMQLVRNAQCPCCESRESETIQHTLFECEAFEEEQEAFLARLYSVCPLARQLTDEYRCRLVMGEKLPGRLKISCTVILLLNREKALGDLFLF